MLALAAERTVERVLGITTADLAHSVSPSAGCRPATPVALQQTITAGFLTVRITNPRVSWSWPIPTIALANHGSVGIIKNLLMMKIQAHGDFLTVSKLGDGAATEIKAAEAVTPSHL
jgi:hypothetical protein